MDNVSRKIIPIRIFLMFTLLDILLWFPFPDIVHLAGMSSLFHLLVFALGNYRSIYTILALIMIPVLIVCTIVFYFMAKRQHRFVPFLVLVGVDLLLSLVLIIYKYVIRNYMDMDVLHFGFGTRLIYFIWMMRCVIGSRTKDEDGFCGS